MLRLLTAGESHGPALTIVVEGLPAGVAVDRAAIDADLRRRQGGYGRGGRMKIESDAVEILSGVRHGATLGSPVSFVIRNRDHENWKDVMSPDPQPPAAKARRALRRPRPGHADLAGALKYVTDDLRSVLERASARETASRVAAGALGKVFLRHFGVEVRSHVRSIGPERAAAPAELELARDGAAHPWWQQVEESPIRTGDAAFEVAATELIKTARTAGDTLGGIFEVIAYGLPIGLGT